MGHHKGATVDFDFIQYLDLFVEIGVVFLHCSNECDEHHGGIWKEHFFLPAKRLAHLRCLFSHCSPRIAFR